MRTLGPVSGTRVVATSPFYFDVPLREYLRGASPLPGSGVVASEVDLVQLRRCAQAATAPVAITGFTLAAVKRTVSYSLYRYRASAPVRVVTASTLAPVKPSFVAFVQHRGT